MSVGQFSPQVDQGRVQYKFFTLVSTTRSTSEVEEDLNALAAQGWRIHSVLQEQGVAILERRVG